MNFGSNQLQLDFSLNKRSLHYRGYCSISSNISPYRDDLEYSSLYNLLCTFAYHINNNWVKLTNNVLEAKITKEDVNVAIKDSDIETLYKRFGHIGEKGLETLAIKGFLPSFSDISLKTFAYSLAGKTHRVAFKRFSQSKKS